MKRKVIKKQLTNTLFVDTKDQHLDEESVLAIHPNKIHWLSVFEKESFEKVLIKNTPTSSLKSLAFFFLAKVLKPNCLIEIFIDQPISVMQALDASEIEANARLAGFVDIQQHEIEFFVRENDKDIKIKSLKMSMVRSDKVVAESSADAKTKK